MANPFLVIGGVAVGVVTAGIGILAVPGWIDSAHDSAAISDLAAISDAQASNLATEATFVPDIETLTETGAAGTRVQPSNGVTWVDLEAENGDYWCATVQSKSGAYFSLTNEAAGPFESDSAEAGLCGSGSRPVEPRQAKFTYMCDVDTPVSLPLVGGEGTVTWEAGGEETELAPTEPFTASAGVEYEVSFSGTASGIKTDSDRGTDCLREVSEWPDGLTSLESAFKGAKNLISVPSTLPSEVTDLSNAFDGASSFNGDLSGWDVSNVTSLKALFAGATSFDGDIGGWDVSNVTNMRTVFYRAKAFNGDISKWDVSRATDMYSMFQEAMAFDGDISNWDVSNVTSMYAMFRYATFNGDISKWDVSSVTNFREMFRSTPNFNGDLSEWDVSKGADMREMFRGATSFNSDLSGWDVSSANSTFAMFAETPLFNSDLSEWDVSNTTDMRSMFYMATAFNSDLSGWDVSNVTDMYSMFRGAVVFSADLSGWDVSKVTSYTNFGFSSGLVTDHLPVFV